MGSKEELLEKITEGIVAGDIDGVAELGKKAIDAGISPEVILEKGGAKLTKTYRLYDYQPS